MELVTYYYYVLFMCVAVVGVVRSASFTEQPTGATVVEGETIVLHCALANKGRYNLFWRDLDSANIISTDTTIDPYNKLTEDKRQRYSITGNHTSGEYDLQITNSSRLDSGRYACLYYSNYNHYSRAVNVRILIPPDEGYPKCSFYPHGAKVGDTVVLSCRSSGGDPPVSLAWVNGNAILRMVIPRNPNPVNEVTHRLETTDLNKVFTCVGTTPALMKPRACRIVPYRKTIFVHVQPLINRIMEGEYASFHCIAGKKSGTMIRWVVGEHIVDPSDPKFVITRKGKRLKMLQTTRREHNNVFVTCQLVDRLGVAGNGSSLLIVTSWATTTATPITTELIDTVQIKLIQLDPEQLSDNISTENPITTTRPTMPTISWPIVNHVTTEESLSLSTKSVRKTPLLAVTTRKTTTVQPSTRNKPMTNGSANAQTLEHPNNELMIKGSKEYTVLTRNPVTNIKTEYINNTSLTVDESVDTHVSVNTITPTGPGHLPSSSTTNASISNTANDKLSTKVDKIGGKDDSTSISNNLGLVTTDRPRFVSNNLASRKPNTVDMISSSEGGDSILNIITSVNDLVKHDNSHQQATKDSASGDVVNDEQSSPTIALVGGLVATVVIITIIIVLSVVFIKRRLSSNEPKAA